MYIKPNFPRSLIIIHTNCLRLLTIIATFDKFYFENRSLKNKVPQLEYNTSDVTRPRQRSKPFYAVFLLSS